MKTFQGIRPSDVEATLPISSDVGLTTPMWSDVTLSTSDDVTLHEMSEARMCMSVL